MEYSRPDGTRRLGVNGVHTCKSPLCPLCAPKYQRTRSEEIARAIDHWGPRRVAFATYTVRHHARMHVGLLHKLLTHAHGLLWSGRRGQALVEELGGKPETVRAHDRTWSDSAGWHPHLHSLLFLPREGLSEGELGELLSDRWAEVVASTARTMTRCLKLCLCKVETEKLRDRATRTFGKKLFPPHVPLSVSARHLESDLRHFTEKAVAPTRERGAVVEYVRRADRVPTYLAKLGLELSWTIGKLGRAGSDGREHFAVWEVAKLCTMHGHPLRVAARRAWAALFRATFGTATITFSSRERLGLGPDPYGDNGEPPEATDDEETRLLGTVDSERWEELRKRHKHGLLVTLHVAHRLGQLSKLPWVEPETGLHAIPRRIERERGPPPRDWVTDFARDSRAASKGRELYRRATRKPPEEPLAWSDLDDATKAEWREELLHRLHDLGAC